MLSKLWAEWMLRYLITRNHWPQREETEDLTFWISWRTVVHVFSHLIINLSMEIDTDIVPSYSCINWGPSKLSNLPKVRQLVTATASTHTWLCLIPDAIYLPELGLLFASDRNQVHGLNERQVLSHMTEWILSPPQLGLPCVHLLPSSLCMWCLTVYMACFS